jgi:hypothetical protein
VIFERGVVNDPRHPGPLSAAAEAGAPPPMTPHQPSDIVVALLGATLIAAVLAPAAVAGTAAPDDRPAAVAQPEGCEFRDDSGHLGYLEAEYDYAAGLANDTADDWTGGEVLRIGANGDCSLAVTNGSAALTAARVDGRAGVLRATVDVGEGGAIRAVAGNDTTASVALENVGRENGAAVAVTVRRANGTTARTNLTAPSGRFVDLAMRWENGTVRVAVREPEERTVTGAWDATVATGAPNASWTVELRSRAYLDEVAVGTRAVTSPPTDDAVGPDPGDGSDADDDLFGPTPPGDGTSDQGSGSGGLVLGPVVAFAGAGIYRFAYGLAKFDEQTDAIGSKTRWSEVEPADWNVALTKGFGALVALVGVGWFLSAVASLL